MPATGVAPGPVRVKVVGLMVVEFIAALKVAVIFWLMPAAPSEASAGLVEVTIGAVVLVLAPVVKVQTKLLARGKSPAL